jgi:uncharacterized protein YfdQ (DUF2303 family)
VTLDQAAVEAIANLGEAAADPKELEVGSYYVATALDGSFHEIDLTGDSYRDQPRRKTGTVVVRDVDSFATYWAKHHESGRSEVYADRDKLTVSAVLDAYGSAAAETGWRQHRLVLQLKHTKAFLAWAGHDGDEMAQEQFAEFLEDNRLDIFDPPAAEMLEVAQSIQSVVKADFAAGFRLVDGQRRIAFTESIESKAGERGELAIPAEIVLRLLVFEGASGADELRARFRHRIQNGHLRLSYKLDRPYDVVTAAFEGTVAEVVEKAQTTVMRGAAAG